MAHQLVAEPNAKEQFICNALLVADISVRKNITYEEALETIDPIEKVSFAGFRDDLLTKEYPEIYKEIQNELEAQNLNMYSTFNNTNSIKEAAKIRQKILNLFIE
jgi:hypothetical protein